MVSEQAISNISLQLRMVTRFLAASVFKSTVAAFLCDNHYILLVYF
ncbi:hypothetical protein PB1A_1781 [Leuconostoc inhae]|uniref:Uncharacterized protein n=2 Tax=Leuconostoc TaxID=1243 RepID=A0AAN2QWW3_9LACO|nr:hypothetical protein C120C_0304 [Leuconostoc inhae]CUW15835.1 hypothetical protein C122C_1400 [Leuconostoc gasicomitatum]CUW14713.1 hypothetical protein KSL4_0273 [Leuconostoc inhae]CUW17546.1 hypothetical protein PB1A_1781 [Leuconostoc inhae]CUW17755.1 hypothetical protein PL111_1422 [Leuconostoc inhae]